MKLRDSLRGYLEDIVKFFIQTHGESKRKLSVEVFVLEHGIQFEFAPRPLYIKKMKSRECFRNAYYLAARDEFIYCEGYAISDILPFPILHAWCVTKEGIVVDPTWDVDSEYFGIPFNIKFVTQRLAERGIYGILDMNWKLFSGDFPKEEWFRGDMVDCTRKGDQRRETALPI